ncbi:hypothetical protein [Enterococcus sp. AZ196]|uniref:hypothetical protein n=1 Tax=Enterococcus sp. AZ196 TaxID=2774659 RepID=UPI003D27087C
MTKSYYREILDFRSRGQIWEEYRRASEPFDPLDVEEIDCILPMPDRSGVLIITEDDILISEQSPLTTLQAFSFAHCFPDHKILSSALQDIGHFGKYKFPWACPYFSLCPMEGGSNSVWINPLKIENVHAYGGLHYVELLNGIKLAIPIQRYYALVRSEIACGILAAIRQDHFHFSMYGDQPMDYLDLPDTSFGRSLKKRPLLKTFVTRKYEVHRRYQRARFLHYYQELADAPQEIDWENWH